MNKKLTKEDLLNTKIYLPTEEINIAVQEELFKLRVYWDNSTNLQYTKTKYFFINRFGHITYVNEKNYFDEHPYKEVKYQDIICEDKTVYKVGDTVEMIKDYSMNGYKLRVGERYKLKYIGRTYCTLYTPYLNCCCPNYEYFKKVEDKPKYKIGTKLKYKKSQRYSHLYGVIRIIKSCEPYDLVDESGISYNILTKGEIDKYMEVVEDEEKEILEERKCREETFLKQHKKNISEENKMELKNIKKENLKIAKANVEKQKRNAEIEYAEQQYRNAVDMVDRLDRDIKQIEDRQKPYLEIIEMFKPTQKNQNKK